MSRRPFCVCFLLLIFLILILKASGFSLWGEPDENIRTYAKSISGQSCVIYGVISSYEEKANSISYFLNNSYHLKNISFKNSNLNSISTNDSFSLQNIQLYFPKEETRIKTGSTVIVYGRPEIYEKPGNPGEFDAAAYYAGKSCCMQMYVQEYKVVKAAGFSVYGLFEELRYSLDKNLHSLMSDKEASVLSAMLLGEKASLDSEIKADYSVAGLSHLLAISGMHVAIMGNAVLKLLYRFKAGLRLSALAASGFTVVYCIFTGSSESAVRACIMFCVMRIGRSLLKSYDQLSALSFAGMIILLLRPSALFRPGFQLSFAAAAGIYCIYPELYVRKFPDDDRRLKKAVKAVKSSGQIWLSVNLSTFPVILWHFYEFPIYSFFSNMIFVPLISLVMVSGAAGAAVSLIYKPVSKVLLLFPQTALQLQNEAGDLISKLPYSKLITGRPELWRIVAVYAGLILLTAAMNRVNKQKRLQPDGKRMRRFFCFSSCILMAILVLQLPQGMSVTALDVGQGDCIVVRNSNKVYMIDGGSSSESGIGIYTIAPYLKSQGIRSIEGIFITHPDLDHTNGVEELFELISDNTVRISVKYIFMPVWMRKTKDGERLSELAAAAGAKPLFLQNGDNIRNGDMIIDILSPDGNSEEEGNNGSLVMSVKYEDCRALFTGDIEDETERKLLGRIGSVDYLKIAHHGSRYSSSENFLTETSPAVCIISAPEKSVYSHPHSETLDRIEDVGAHWYQTGITGAVRADIEKGRLKITTYRNTE